MSFKDQRPGKWKYAAGTSGITSAATTEIKAGTASRSIAIEGFDIANTHASQAVKCTLQDATGNVLWRTTLAAGAAYEKHYSRSLMPECVAGDALQLVTDAAGVIWFNAHGDQQ